jgi:endonuclease
MALYDKPVRLLFRDMVADLDLKKGETITRQQGIAWFKTNYPKIKSSTVSAHFIKLSTNAPSRTHYHANPEDDLFFQAGPSHFRLYEPETDAEPTYDSPEARAGEEEEEPEGVGVASEFAYESDLRGFLAKNLYIMEPGLQLYEDEGITGVEFPAGGRFIDILAVDENNDYLVVELKVSRGYDRVIGQLLRYMAWVGRHLAERDQRVRGAIVARVITEDLLLACSQVPGVMLFEYEMSVTVRKVGAQAGLGQPADGVRA